ncbi:MAG: type III toxin-antitoxin system ToxN/AbiQ family toxin [Spirochaetaceae bacterium]|nr:type III toxin-antitoxin system ToxN/AbiQ family toxin [Spirochaetaceae bacterium]
MFSLEEKLSFINVNQEYLKYLHDFCSEVYYKPFDYENKPYLGILINSDGKKYVLPLSSAKEKHKSWKNIEADRFLIYENCDISVLSKSAVYKANADGSVKHIFSVLDLKKMIPVKDGLYKKVNLNSEKGDSVQIRNYKNLLNKEYSFCLKIIDTIIQKATKLYDKQMKTGRIIPFCCNFKLLEAKCEEYCGNG